MVRRRETAPTVFVGVMDLPRWYSRDTHRDQIVRRRETAPTVGEPVDHDVGCANPIATHRVSEVHTAIRWFAVGRRLSVDRDKQRDQILRRLETAPTVFSGVLNSPIP